MTPSASLPLLWQRIQQYALAIGIGGLVLCGIGAFVNQSQFFRSYLLAYLFWLGLSLGCLPILMLHHLVGGAWGAVVRRILEAGSRLLPVMALLFLPLLVGLHDLYIWARPEAVAADVLLQHKRPYLNTSFFVLRSALYLLFWLALAYGLNKWAHPQDQASAALFERRLRALSGPGLALYVLTMTFAAVDWMMSLEPHWFSTIYGVMVIVGQVLATLAFAIVALRFLADIPSLSNVVVSSHFHDLGTLLLAFVMLWAYMGFSQFLIIWSGNLPEEIPWYIHRMHGGWGWTGLIVILFYFILPFFLLLSRTIKGQGALLARVAVALLVMHIVELYWLIGPSFYPTGLALHWLDVVTLIGLGGIWLATFLWQLRRHPLLPTYDPGLEGVTSHG